MVYQKRTDQDLKCSKKDKPWFSRTMINLILMSSILCVGAQ